MVFDKIGHVEKEESDLQNGKRGGSSGDRTHPRGKEESSGLTQKGSFKLGKDKGALQMFGRYKPTIW